MNQIFDPTKLKKIILDEGANGGMNVSDEQVLEQVAVNIRRGLPQVRPHQPNMHTVSLVCGGPSLAMSEKELVQSAWAGDKIVAVNGAYQWCIDHNIKPAGAIVLDAREFNTRFLEEPVEGCKYFIAAQCHPRMFDICKDRETYIWHACSAGDAEQDMLKEYYFDKYFAVDIGVTIGVRAVSLLRMLGFTSQRIWALDSCWLDDKHHAYGQPENDRDRRVGVFIRPQGHDVRPERFECSGWHIKQAETFMQLVKERGDLFRLDVRGPGLIAAIMRTGAQMQLEQEGAN